MESWPYRAFLSDLEGKNMFLKKDEMMKIESLMVKGPGLPILDADRPEL